MDMPEIEKGSSREARRRIIIRSVGSAAPAAAAALAKGLGLAPATVISRIYRAPAVLVDQVKSITADRMAALLAELGYEIEIQSMDMAPPEPPVLYDVCLYVENPARLTHAVVTLARFTGLGESEAFAMIMSPPGMVLGSVSQATIDAFERQLGEGVELIASQPELARYHLFLADAPEVIRRRLLDELKVIGIEPRDTVGLVVADLDYAAAQSLWQRSQSGGFALIVNRDFLRFDVVLQPSGEPPTAAQRELLFHVAGIPEDLCGEVFDNAPITLLEAVPSLDLEQKMQELVAVGLPVKAELITFQRLGLRVLSVKDRQGLRRALESFGLHSPGRPLPRAPFRIPGALPALQARVLRVALEQNGARVEFDEAA